VEQRWEKISVTTLGAPLPPAARFSWLLDINFFQNDVEALGGSATQADGQYSFHAAEKMLAGSRGFVSASLELLLNWGH
jgi:hypothetical protein